MRTTKGAARNSANAMGKPVRSKRGCYPMPGGLRYRPAKGFFDGSHDLIKGRGIGHGKIGQDLSIQLDMGLRQPIDELAVSQTSLTDGGIDADDPELTEFPLPVATIAKGINAGTDECFFGASQQATTPADKSLHFMEETLLGLIPGGTFYGTHGYESSKSW